MLELFNNRDDAISILKHDHDKVKGLFEQFEKAENLREKRKIAAQAIRDLKIHAEIEEKIFYPAVREEVEKDLMNEADEEHHVAKLLIAELDQMDGSEEHWEAKFTVLAENILHHIKEEEGEMLPQARQLDIDFHAVGKRLLVMKQLLTLNGVPASDEEKLMMRGLVDSPARAAGDRRAKPATRSMTSKKSPRTGRKSATRTSRTNRTAGRTGTRKPTTAQKNKGRASSASRASASPKRKTSR